MPLDIPDQTIAAQVKVPDMMSTLGNILNVAQGKVNLEKSRATLGADIAQRNAESQQAVGMVQPTLDTAKSNAQTADQQARQQKLITLRAHLANGVSQLAALHGTGATPDQVKSVLISTMQNAGAPAEAIQQAAANIPTDPAQVDRFIVQRMAGAMDISSQLDKVAPAPQMVNNGQVQIPVAGGNEELTGIKPGTINGIGIKNQITPSQEQTYTTDSQQRPVVVQKAPSGEITNVTGAPVNGQATQGPLVLPQGETQQSMQELITKRQAVSDAASQVPDQHYNNQAIKKILDSGGSFAATGSNASIIKKLGGLVGNPLGNKEAENINTINHYLALQTQSAEKAMGVHTDAGQAVAGAAAGDVMQDPKSLRTTININDATSSALDYFNRGKEAAIKNGGNNGIFAQRDFQNSWSQAYGRYGPYAMRLMNAGQTNDKSEINAVTAELGGKNSPKFKQMLFTAQRLDNLARTGKP